MSEEDAPPAPPHNGNGVGDPPPHVVGDPPPHGVCVADPPPRSDPLPPGQGNGHVSPPGPSSFGVISPVLDPAAAANLAAAAGNDGDQELRDDGSTSPELDTDC